MAPSSSNTVQRFEILHAKLFGDNAKLDYPTTEINPITPGKRNFATLARSMPAGSRVPINLGSGTGSTLVDAKVGAAADAIKYLEKRYAKEIKEDKIIY
ncbi:hypothetical protein EST38_g358 [Candolleomyces aberdarensis]|uniref:Uncharacterized protein n=1 Tax=Candolleomyces aberdarensis TaxID=2316362 RepID=A0A4Q2DYF0_9AGAR|nr:hypothetical protein EST38_g358 [Candolleomyces aberdarensis]